MTDTVVKVFEEGCIVCETMSRFDKSVLEAFPGADFKEISFDEIQDYERDPFRQKIYRLLETYAVSSTYELEFPTYLFLGKGGQYKGFLQGALELKDFREGVKKFLDESSE